MGAGRCCILVKNVGMFDPPQRVAFIASLTATGFARRATQTSSDPWLLTQSIARRRFAALGAVQTQAPPSIGDLFLHQPNLRHQAINNRLRFRGYVHTPNRLISSPSTPAKSAACTPFHQTRCFPDSQNGLGVTLFFDFSRPAHIPSDFS